MEHIRSGSKETESDETLVRVVQRKWGEPAGRRAASVLVTRYQKAVYGWCYRYARNPDAALDLTQEVLIAVYEKLPTLREPERFSAWLFIIARNTCFKAMRKRREYVTAEAVDVVDNRQTADSDLLVIEHEQKEILLRMIAILEPVEQDAVWMRYIDGLSLSHIEELLGIGSTSGARGVLQRAMRKLRARYGKHRRGEGSKEGLS